MRIEVQHQLKQLKTEVDLSLFNVSDKLKHIEDERKEHPCPSGLRLERNFIKAMKEVEQSNNDTKKGLAVLGTKTDVNTKSLSKIELFVDETKAAGWRLVTKIVSAVGVVVVIGLQIYQICN